jgi:hypothetical protein
VSDERDDPGTVEPGMHKEVITIPGDRYLIYYTFDAGDVTPSSSKGERA